MIDGVHWKCYPENSAVDRGVSRRQQW
jgi:hypothetical protein